MSDSKDIKQVIVVRKDLNMRKGKIAAQAAHASMKVFLDRGRIENITSMVDGNYLIVPIDCQMKEWINGLFTKIVVYVNSKDEFFYILEQLQKSDLPYAVVEDSGKTEFNNIPTFTALAIGPAESHRIDGITGHLPLL